MLLELIGVGFRADKGLGASFALHHLKAAVSQASRGKEENRPRFPCFIALIVNNKYQRITAGLNLPTELEQGSDRQSENID